MKKTIANLSDYNYTNFDLTIIVKSESVNTKSLDDSIASILSESSTVEEKGFLLSTLDRKNRNLLLEINLEEDLDHREVNKIAKKAAKLSLEEKITKPAIVLLDEKINSFYEQFIKAYLLHLDSFDTYKNKKEEAQIEEIAFYALNNNYESLINDAFIIFENVNFARYLVNEPANFMTPSQLAEDAKKFSERNNIEVEIKGYDEIKELEMDAFLSVAKGSAQEPKLIVLRYLNNPESDDVLGLVGKGVTYDSGGYAIKPATGMLTMHSDMGGSAAVIGAINLLAAKKAKVNAVAVVAACENMISGDAFKNGDIISSMSKKSIEVINTDAEGRLTLADAIWYAHSEEKVNKIVDIATLTGAVFAALGKDITGVVSNDDDFFKNLEKSSKISGDKIWRLPCDEDLAKCNISKRADIKNASSCGAGTTTAGLFLREFTNDLPWTHLDIAFTSYQKEDDFNPEGATGVGVELLANACELEFKE